jgi:hypothetical protein
MAAYGATSPFTRALTKVGPPHLCRPEDVGISVRHSTRKKLIFMGPISRVCGWLDSASGCPAVIFVLQQGTPADAVYTFKHALVQDSAYDSLLKRRRQELHGKIAKAIEARFPTIGETEPELLAHHYTEAKQPETAIPLWQKAGSLALNRLALAEAIAHLNKGLELVAALPPSAERDTSELELRTLLGTAWTALKGWQVQDVWDNLHPALGRRTPFTAMTPVADTLRTVRPRLARGRIAESLQWVAQLTNAAETYGDRDLLILGHFAAMIARFWLGEPIKVREHAERVLALYSAERLGHLADILNRDPNSYSLMFSAQSTWMLGYPEQALRISDAKDAHARQRGHPFGLGWALTVGVEVFDYLREPDEMLKRIEEGDRLGRENSLPFVTECLAPQNLGTALIRRGQTAEGMALVERGLAVWEAAGSRVGDPYWKSVLAEGMAQLGNVAGALVLVDEAIEQVERPGWEERHYYAKALRIKGSLLLLKGDPEAAEPALSPRSTARERSRRNPGSCAPRRAMRG